MMEELKKKDFELSEGELKEIEDLERRGEVAVKKALAGEKEVVVGRAERVTFIKEDEDGNVTEESTYENPSFKLITVEEVIEIHDKLIRKYGGKSGVLNKGLLEFPVDWINQRRSLFWKVAVLMRGIICRHPFVDGNKRTGLVVADIILNFTGYQFVDEEEVKNFVLELARSEKEIDEIVEWLNAEANRMSKRTFPERPLGVLRPKYEKELRKSMQRFDNLLKELSKM